MAPTLRPQAAILPPDPLNTTDLSRFALLVTTYNIPSRTTMYTARLRWWLANSALDLFVVDSAGRCFPAIDAPPSRFRCFAFNQSAEPLLAALEANRSLCDPPCLGVPRSSVTERLAITKALTAFAEPLARKQIVLKMTGKYVLPDLDGALRAVPPGAAAVVQSVFGGGWQDTELWGMSAPRLAACLADMPPHRMMERRAYECVADAAYETGLVTSDLRADPTYDPSGTCPSATEVARSDYAHRWDVWDAPGGCDATPCPSLWPSTDVASSPRCGFFVAPCCVRPRAEALPHTVAASPTPSVYRLPPMQVPEEWRTKRGDGSTLSELLATGNASAAPWTRVRRVDVV